MKKTMLTTAILVTTTIAGAQDADQSGGKVGYEVVTRLDIKLEGDAGQFSDLLPKENKSIKDLCFNAAASLYSNSKEEGASMDEVAGSGEAMIKLEINEPDDLLYRNLETMEQVEQREFMTRTFLIREKYPKQAWKLTGRQKMILDFPCQEAELESDDDTVTAWFTPTIPVSVGPDRFGGLPGLILSVDENNGQRVITARSVEFTDPAKVDLEIPKKGKKVSRSEFNAIVAEKKKEMGTDQGGESRQMILRIEH